MAEAMADRAPTENEMLDEIAVARKSIEKAMGQLVAMYRQRLLQRIQREIKEYAPAVAGVLAAEDVVQEAGLKAFCDVLCFRPVGQGSFYPWLAKIADNTLTDKFRSLGALKRGGGRKAVSPPAEDRSDFDAYVGLLELAAIESNTPSKSVARREAAERLKSTLGELNARQCAALILCHLHGWSRERAAEAMHITKAALGSFLNRGLQSLRQVLGTKASYLAGK
jgi:RNA polymerase sigma-70 factor (ECF subfamily)